MVPYQSAGAKITAPIAALCIGMLLIGMLPTRQASAQKPGAGQGMQVLADRVTYRRLTDSLPVIGRVVAGQQGAVASPLAGLVVEILVQDGDRVQPDAVLFRLDVSALQIRRRELEAELARLTAKRRGAMARRDMTALDANRAQQLRSSVAFNQARLDRSKLERQEAEAALAEGSAELARVKAQISAIDLDLNRSVIRAPYPGVVTRRHVEKGAFLSVGAAGVTLLNDQKLEIAADIPAKHARTLSPGTLVVVDMGDGKAYLRARLRTIIPEENALSRTMIGRAVLLSAPDGMALNRSVTVYIPAGAPRRVLTVHKDAIVLGSGKGPIVHVVENGTTMPRPVTLGRAVGSRLVVREGLQKGDVVVTRGNERLLPGTKVTVRFSEKTAR